MAWWGWVLLGWAGISVIVAVPLGMAIRAADRMELEAPAGGLPHPEVAFAADVAARKQAAREARRARRQARRRIPVPPIAITLAGLGVTLEAVGLVVRAAGHDRAGQLWSMDQPLSAPRLYVTRSSWPPPRPPSWAALAPPAGAPGGWASGSSPSSSPR